VEKKKVKNVLNQKEECCGCSSCYNICPVQAIEMQPDEEGFLYPTISEKKCIGCGKCKKVCPIIHKPPKLPLKLAYGCYAKKQEEQMESSSGGVFSVLARKVLLENGIVCGAAYDEKQLVFHLIIESENELSRLKGTKYVQSRIENVFTDIKKFLIQNRMVLFSGTPCQVAGLKSFLGKEYDKLICVDLICHGVPSPKVWEHYLKQISKGNKVEKVTFRNKSQGMDKITLDYYLNDGNIIKESYSESLYMKGFIQNLYVRPSCFECKFKGASRCSDLTIGDFWAVKEYHPKFHNNNGASAIIIHSEKGEKWMEKVEEDLYIVRSTIKEIACWNECLLESTVRNNRRKDFFSQWKDKELDNLLKELTTNYVRKEKLTALQKIKRSVRTWLR